MASFKNTLIKSMLLYISVINLASCQFKGIKGSGNVTTETRNVDGNFKSITAARGLDVVLEQSNTTSVTVIADDNLQRHILVSVENGVLKITSDVNNYMNVDSKEVIVKAPSIESIEVSSGVTFKTKNTIKCNAIALKASSGSILNIAIESETASCESSSGSSMKVHGKAITLETAASSGSVIDAEKLLSNDIIANASSGSSISVYPLVKLEAKASSGASINYFNVPKNLNKKASSGGSIAKG